MPARSKRALDALTVQFFPHEQKKKTNDLGKVTFDIFLGIVLTISGHTVVMTRFLDLNAPKDAKGAEEDWSVRRREVSASRRFEFLLSPHEI